MINTRLKLLFIFFLTGLLFVFATPSAPAAAQSEPERVIIYFFWGQTCPYCHQQIIFLDELQAQYPHVVVREYEIYNSRENRTYLERILARRGLQVQGVPTTLIHDRHWVGFNDNVARQITAAVEVCSQMICSDPGAGIVPVDEALAPAPAPEIEIVASGDEQTIALPFIGEISLAGQSLWFSTVLISFVDGFNPCSLWVLSILLALVIHSGSRKKTLIVGLTFLITTTLVYGLFIVGLFSIFTFVGFIGWIQVAVALLALGFALINIKDYFWYKEGVSFTIADRHKPGIYRNIRGLMSGEKSDTALIGATAAMALGIALVELPCTTGFPLLWTNLLAAHEVTALMFAMLLGLYMLIYLADELFVFGTVVVTLKASKFEEKQGRILKLIGGMIMLALAITLLIDPGIMNDIGSSVLVFGLALLAAVALLVIHRQILPRWGVYIGTEITPRKSRGK